MSEEKIDDGGPASPCVIPVMSSHSQLSGALQQVGVQHFTGLSKREAVAMQFANGLFSNPEIVKGIDLSNPKHMAGLGLLRRLAFEQADAFLAESKKAKGKAMTNQESKPGGPDKEKLKEFIEEWRYAAMCVGERLSSVGPTGYYKFTAEEWFKWARENANALLQETARLKEENEALRAELKKTDKCLEFVNQASKEMLDRGFMVEKCREIIELLKAKTEDK